MKFIRIAIVLLAAVVLTTSIVSITYSKYMSTTPSSTTSGRVASFGKIELKEHEAVLKNGVYELTENVIPTEKVTGNIYSKVIPGVDINKDPFIVVSGKFEVSFELHIKIVENNFPKDKQVTYELTSDWEPVSGKVGEYKYVGTLIPIGEKIDNLKIEILKGNQLIVSENYKGNGAFSLKLSAWIQQIN